MANAAARAKASGGPPVAARRSPARRAAVVVASLVLFAAVAAAFVWRRLASPGAPPAPPAAEMPSAAPAPAPAPMAAAVPARRTVPGGPLLVGGEVYTLALDELPAGRPLQLHLDVPALPGDATVLQARVLAMDAAPLEKPPLQLLAAVGGERTHASVRIDPAWLTPGRYVVEIRTPERTHFPIRRYAVDVVESR